MGVYGQTFKVGFDQLFLFTKIGEWTNIAFIMTHNPCQKGVSNALLQNKYTSYAMVSSDIL